MQAECRGCHKPNPSFALAHELSTHELYTASNPTHTQEMSDDESSASSSEGEDLNLTGLVATRAKRRTAGNLYETLRQNLDDEELQKELLAEDEAEDAEDYRASDREDDDAAMESSSDDEDAAAAEDEDAGEKELKRAERAEQRKKRKVQEARMRIPGVIPKKRVKLADDVKVEDGGSAETAPLKKKKKSERSDWLPDVGGQTRQSSRRSAVETREQIFENLKISRERSERQRELMKTAAQRGRATDRANLTQEQRLEKCRRIERETEKELGRFEREEAERVRAREEALAAKRRKGIEGPIIRIWSGSGVYEDGKLKLKRLEGRTLDDYEDEVRRKEEAARVEAIRKAEEARRKEEERIEAARREAERLEQERIEAERAEAARKEAEKSAMDLINWDSSSRPGTAENPPANVMEGLQQVQGSPVDAKTLHSHSSMDWLSGIHEYAAQDKPEEAHTQTIDPTATQQPDIQPPPASQPVHVSTMAPPVSTPATATTKPTYPAWPPGSATFSATPHPIVPPPPPAPVLREQAQRTLIILESFPDLATTSSTTSGASKSRKSLLTASTTSNTSTGNNIDPTPLSNILIPSTHALSLTPEERLYLTKMRKSAGVVVPPDPPIKPKCAITGWHAKFRDPKTGLPYADLQTYKIVQRMVAGGCGWSGLLGCWVGPSYGKMGRPARGVPEGFAGESGVKRES